MLWWWMGTGQLKCDGTRAETRFRLSAKRVSPFKSAGSSVQSTGSRSVRIRGSNAGYTMFRGSVKGTGYSLHSLVSLSLPLLCVVCQTYNWSLLLTTHPMYETVSKYVAGTCVAQISVLQKSALEMFCEHRLSSLVCGYLYASQAQTAARDYIRIRIIPNLHTHQNNDQLLIVLANHKTVVVRGRQRNFDNPGVPRSNPQILSTLTWGWNVVYAAAALGLNFSLLLSLSVEYGNKCIYVVL